MTQLKIALLFPSLTFIAVLFFCMNNSSDSDDESTIGDTGYKGLYGRLVDREGRPVTGAAVKAIDIVKKTLEKRTVGAAAFSSNEDSAATDDSGYYSFESLDAGNYNIQGDYGGGEMTVLITGIRYDGAGAIQEVETDTLCAPGQIAGTVNTTTDDNAGVLCYIPGTTFLAMTDDSGRYVLSNIPRGRISITFRKAQLKTVTDTGLVIHSGERTILSTRNMEADTVYPPPVPGGLTVSYDTLHGWVLLGWKPVAVADLAGYVIFRNDSASSVPRLIHERVVEDTIYKDVVFNNLSDTTDCILTYRIKAQDKEANQSEVFSKAVIVHASSPTKVRTFITWQFLNSLDDSISINDTVTIIAFWFNATRKNIELQWFLNAKDSSFKAENDSAFSGSDTIHLSWDDTMEAKIYIAATDDDSAVWWDSTSVSVVQDIPVVDAGMDTTIKINTRLTFRGIVRQSFGSIVISKWDFDGDGTDDDSSTTLDSVTHTYPREGEYTARFHVRDDDGNEGFSVRHITVVNKAPVISSIRHDTTISINDSIPLFGSAGDPDGTIVEYAWDFNGNGTFDYTSATSITVWSQYATVGNHTTVLKVTDDDANEVRDTTTVTVVQDMPVVDAGNDTVFDSNDTVRLYGAATQRFGNMVKWEWKIGAENWSETSSPDTFFKWVSTEISVVCSLAAVDDDGNRSTDDIKIGFLPKGKSVAGGNVHSLFLMTDGTVWGCGHAADGELGTDINSPIDQPIQIMSDVMSISAGIYKSLMLKTDHTVWWCGTHANKSFVEYFPSQLLVDVKNYSAGGFYGLIVKDDGTMFAFGNEECGLNGIILEGLEDQYTPIQIMNDVRSVSAGFRHSLVLKTDGTLWINGCNECNGIIGDAIDMPREMMSDVIDMFAGFDENLILKKDSTLWFWDFRDACLNSGDTTTNRPEPVYIMDKVRSISAGDEYVMILKTDGTLWIRGTSYDDTSSLMMSDVQEISAGNGHYLILKTDGTFWGFGSNQFGQLGEHAEMSQSLPVRIMVGQR